jgi:hypothetical protein
LSTINNPEDKKRLSLDHDRRNTFGEDTKASRKGIQKGKRRRHKDERRTVGSALGCLKGSVLEDEGTDAELLAKIAVTQNQRKGLKKKPDTPLRAVLAAKKSKSGR